MSIAFDGGCSCGAIRYRLASEPLVVHCCHCLNCQRQTGSAFVVNLLIEADRVELLAGEPQPVDAPRDIAPDVHIFTRSKVGWVTIPEGAPAFEVFYDMQELWPAESIARFEAVMASRSSDS